MRCFSLLPRWLGQFLGNGHTSLRGAMAAMVALTLLPPLSSCNERRKSVDPPLRIDDWEVACYPDLLPGNADGWVVFSPANPHDDKMLYNGLYRDEYVDNDSVNATVIFDSVAGYFISLKRMVTINVNPDSLWVTAKITGQSPRHLSLTRTDSLQSLFKVKEPGVLDSLMLSGETVCMLATTPPAMIASSGNAQTYSFAIRTKGFSRARSAAYRLNTAPPDRASAARNSGKHK